MILLAIAGLLGGGGWITPVATAIGSIVGSIITYMVTKDNNDKDISISERKQLSQDQYKLIGELLKETKILKNDMKSLQELNIELTIQNRELANQNIELQEKVSQLTEENKKLHNDIRELTYKVEKIYKQNDK